eukprot:GEMP01038359.1.p1 GENE.GEMP01038359.1~~GEMP01038359.1.p1  ORF type:complete len:272 (+),score=56.29 GEMP01038359.1:83-898(+)
MVSGYAEIAAIFVYGATAIFACWFVLGHLTSAEDDLTTREVLLLALQLCALHVVSQLVGIKKKAEESNQEEKVKNGKLEVSLENVRNQLMTCATALRSRGHVLQQVFYANRQMRNEISQLKCATQKALLEKKEAANIAYDIYAARIEQAAWLKALVVLAALPTFLPIVYFSVAGYPTDYDILCSTVAAVAVAATFALIDVKSLFGEDEACQISQVALLDIKPGRRMPDLVMDNILCICDQEEALQAHVPIRIGDILGLGLQRRHHLMLCDA